MTKDAIRPAFSGPLSRAIAPCRGWGLPGKFTQ